MPKPHYYKHLDNDILCNVNIELNMKQLAEQVCSVNYGLHRFLSETIDIKRRSEWPQDLELADKLEAILNEGHD